MLAYLFWHRAKDLRRRADYESALVAFHAALSQSPPEGFIRSHTFHLPDAPWLGGEGYEDWYLLDGARAIEPLNSVAVSGSVKAPHDAAARMASFGTAGLYQSVRTGGDQLEASTAVWFSKPEGMSYDAMYSRLESNGPEVQDRLWQRMMTLGPTPEFCLLGGGPDFLPYGWTSTMVVKRPVRV